MRLLIILICFLLVNIASAQTFSRNISDANITGEKFDSLLYNVDLGDYESLQVKSCVEKKHEDINVEIGTSELSHSLPVLFDNSLIFQKSNGLYYVVDINTKLRDSCLERVLRGQNLDGILMANGILLGYQMKKLKLARGNIVSDDDRVYVLDSKHRWHFDTTLNPKMFNFFCNGIFEYKDEYLNVRSAYSHSRPNTLVKTVDNHEFELNPFVNSIVKDNDVYLALTNRDFMSTGPSIYQLAIGVGGEFDIAEKFKIHQTSFITSFKISNSIFFLCRRDNLNFLCEYDSGSFYFNSTFPVDDKLGYYTYKVVNLDNSIVLLFRTSEGSLTEIQPLFYIVDENRIITVKLKDH